jgi:hypothetical protein
MRRHTGSFSSMRVGTGACVARECGANAPRPKKAKSAPYDVQTAAANGLRQDVRDVACWHETDVPT